MLTDYQSFLDRKSQFDSGNGFEPVWRPDFLFDFQAALHEWSQRQGRAAILADCGLGKSPLQLSWGENVVRKTNRPILIATPLAVSAQTLREAEKFGIEAARSLDGAAHPGKINVTNYERLHLFDPNDFAGMVCDESSILKNFDGARRAVITDFMRKMEFRLLCTATAAPNDYIELGTSSEALGYLGHMDMLGRFFRNDQNNASHRTRPHSTRFGRTEPGKVWRFKGHARQHFWRWVCSWARALRKPSDLGFDDARFVLPELIQREHLVQPRTKAPGMLFDVPAQGLSEEREEQRRTLTERCEKAAELVNDTGEPAVCWCHLNPEGDLLTRLIPDAQQIRGADSIERKEELFAAFSSGQLRVLVIKPKIGAWGLNWTHCNHMTTFPSHSFEQWYQSVRRSWRFGQKRPVTIDTIATESAAGIVANGQRKARQADEMFSELVAHMNDALRISRSEQYTKPMEIPQWLS